MKDKNKLFKMMERKYVIAIDFSVVVGTFIIIAFFIGYTRPLVIFPIDDFTTTNKSVLFSFEKANVILIDDNPEFTSPQEIYVEDNLVINLKPGVYYWKAEGISSSEIRKLTINSEVDLKLKKSDIDGFYEIVNAGNTRLRVEVYKDNELTANVVLNVDESDKVSGTKFIGKENDE